MLLLACHRAIPCQQDRLVAVGNVDAETDVVVVIHFDFTCRYPSAGPIPRVALGRPAAAGSFALARDDNSRVSIYGPAEAGPLRLRFAIWDFVNSRSLDLGQPGVKPEAGLARWAGPRSG
jgi:hypothetical protein